ncbi:MAG: hypothetical protein J6Y28_01505 [Acholeplasmatales bacterium]|nr:hypothetical protein [Acholeplasmatales bacterium]
MKGKVGNIIFIVILFALMIALAIIGLINSKKEEEYFVPSFIYPRVEMKVNDYTLYIRLDNNPSANAFYQKINENETLTIKFTDNTFEKVGNLGFTLTTNDSTQKAEANDVMLYQGNKLCLFYDENTYSYTKLGKIINNTGVDLKTILSGSEVTISFKIESLIVLFGE